MSQKITIIGGGFAGTMLTVLTVRKATSALEINVIDENGLFGRGIAYSSYSKKHILNVVAGKMSAFQNDPDHFLNWLSFHPDFKEIDRSLVANAFLSRRLYGDYLENIWKTELSSLPKNITVNLYQESVIDLNIDTDKASVILSNGMVIESDKCILATGNSLPKDPKIKDSGFFRSKNYFRNPWSENAVLKTKNDLPVLIIGNGLTMVDTVVGLNENGFSNTIYSLSPNGFNILPHRHSAIAYSGLQKDLEHKRGLAEIAGVVIKHIKIVRSFGISAEPVIDSLRPLTQKIWQGFSTVEKRIFMSRFRHLWGVARHRLPLHTYDKIQSLKVEGKLKIISGTLIDIEESDNEITVLFKNNRNHSFESIKVQRVINCTGPDSDIATVPFLNPLLRSGFITQDELKLGVNTDSVSFETINSSDQRNSRLLAIGSLLRGILWESTAVNELRSQSERISDLLAIKSKKENEKQYI